MAKKKPYQQCPKCNFRAWGEQPRVACPKCGTLYKKAKKAK